VPVLVFLISWSAASSQAANILFIGETSPPAEGDPGVIDHLESLGHTVAYELGIDTTGDDVAGFDLLIMSATNLTVNIRDNGFESIPQPILTWESSMVRAVPGEFWMTQDQLSNNLGTAITVTDASHPIMAGLNVQDGDELEIFTEDQNFFGLIGDLAPGASLVAVGAEPCCVEDRLMIVEIPSGGQTLAGSGFPDDASPGARVFIPLSNTSFDFLNEAGLQLFDNALSFALGVTFVRGDFSGNGTLDAADIDDLTDQTWCCINPSYDLNGDALINQDDIQVWVKDLFNSWIGDANLDGEFNSSDLVTVLASGTYEADVNAVWTTGDFNGDGRASSSDLVAALADGGYELGPRPPVAAVPEPVGCLLLALGLGSMLVRRRP
jgi:hypothetical protein